MRSRPGGRGEIDATERYWTPEKLLATPVASTMEIRGHGDPVSMAKRAPGGPAGPHLGGDY
jgi:hypothetical protein